jgi:DNA-directed RNA polymerase II subunit RPB1
MDINHSQYKEENNMIKNFIKHNPLLKVPTDLINWSVRLEIDREKLIEKNMKLETICFRLFELNPNLYIVNNAENTSKPNNIVVRIYIRAAQFKKSLDVDINSLETFINTRLLNSIIRGVDGVLSTDISAKLARSKIMEDGSISKVNKNVIMTDGTNLATILCNEFVDPYQTQSDSIVEISHLLGIEAANNAIVINLSSMMPSADPKYYRVYADTMTSTGVVTSIDRQGIQSREKNNSLLLLSNSHPLQELETIAINGSNADCTRASSQSLMVGTTPKQCSNFNKVIVNRQFIQDNVVDLESQLTDL